MIVTLIHKERALKVAENGNTDQSIKDTLKIIYCLVDEDKKQEVEKLYNSLFEMGKKNDGTLKKICKLFFG